MNRTVDDLMYEVEEVAISLPREDWLAIVTQLEIIQGHQGLRPIEPTMQAGVIEKRIIRQLVEVPHD
jgi:hypothetical protein